MALPAGGASRRGGRGRGGAARPGLRALSRGYRRPLHQAAPRVGPHRIRGVVSRMSDYQHTVYWQQTESAAPGPALDEDVTCDVCIVGGGFTGMWTAHFLKLADPDLKVRIV